jgi:L-amino acid N-acyltransferase YncA
MSDDLAFVSLQPDDWEAVARIYDEGIRTGLATLEPSIPTWETWNEAHLPQCRLIARLHGDIVAWAALLPVSKRKVYAGVAEESIYVGEAARGRGVGKRLLNALIEASEAAGFWTLQAVILRDNTASVGLHEACGFRIVGYRERIGFARGKWHDTVFMERRSGVVGV